MIGGNAAPGRQPVWDLPIRLFHWLLAALIGFSWWSVTYHHIDWHLWSGFAILTLLIFRLLYGVFGSSTARFNSFVRGPASVFAYLRNPHEWRYAGHTPLGALSVIALLGLTAAQVGLGLIAEDEDGLYAGPLAPLVSIDRSDWARHIHETLFWVLVGFIALHVAAILYYRVVRRKPLAAAMITGRGQLEDGIVPMRPARWWVPLLCLAVAFGITRWIVAGAPPFGP